MFVQRICHIYKYLYIYKLKKSYSVLKRAAQIDHSERRSSDEL